MSILICDGNPGTGKTLYGVHHLVTTHYDFNASEGMYYPKTDQPFVVVTNFEEFALEHESLQDWIAEAGNKDLFFSEAYQEKLFEKHGSIYYLIDEAQKYFPRKYYNEPVFNWFEYHRHFGQQIYLFTQHESKLPKDITCMVEYVIRALPKSRSLWDKYYHYNLMSGRESLGSERILSNQRLFALYKSQRSTNLQQVKRPFVKTLILTICFVLVVGSFGAWSLFTRLRPVHASEQTASIVSPKQTYFPTSKSAETTGETEVYELVKISSFTVGNKISLLYNGVWSPADFPYSLQKIRGEYYAKIPAVVHQARLSRLAVNKTDVSNGISNGFAPSVNRQALPAAREE